MKPEKILLLLAIIINLAFCATSQSKIGRENEKDPQHHYERAIVAMKYGLPEQAIKNLNQALSLDPNHYQSYNLLGHIYFEKMNFAEAASAYQKCLEIKPDFSEVRNNLGFVYQKMGSPYKAEEEYKESYSIDNNYEASFNLAKLYFDQNKLELASDYIQKSLRENWRSSKAYNLRGVILNKMGRYPEAIQSFQNALRIAPNDIIASVNLAVAYINNKDFDLARELLEKTLSLVQEQTLKDKIKEYLKLIKEKEKDD